MDTEKMDEMALLQRMVARPAAFIGENRLDYIQNFFEGYCCSERLRYGNPPEWNDDYDLQRWLFSNQSVSIRTAASLNGWTLFYRCFGYRKTAIRHFTEFLNTSSRSTKRNYSLNDTVSHNIYSIFSYYQFDDDAKEFQLEANKVIKLIKLKEKGIITLVKEMFDADYDELKIYIHCEQYFMQVRFLYHTAEGWHEDSPILWNKDNYSCLVALHAFVECIMNERNERVIISEKNGNMRIAHEAVHSVEPFPGNRGGGKSLFSQYNQWKRSIMK